MDCYNAGLPYGHVNAVRSYIALREKIILNSQPITGAWAVKLALRGYRRKSPVETVRRPIVLASLLLLLACPIAETKKLHLLLGYLFMLRTSEVQGLFEGDNTIQQTRKGWKLFLRRSKADKYSKGVSVFFPDECLPKNLIEKLKTLLPLLKKEEKQAPSALNAAIKMALGGRLRLPLLAPWEGHRPARGGLAPTKTPSARSVGNKSRPGVLPSLAIRRGCATKECVSFFKKEVNVLCKGGGDF